MAARSSIAWLMRELRRKVNDEGPALLDDDEYYAGDSVKLTCTYRDLSGNATDPSSPTVAIWDSEGTKKIDGGTPTSTGLTGEYEYIYRIPADGPEGVWRVEFAGTVGGHISEQSREFEVFTTKRTWTDDQLQSYLDMHRVHIRREPLMKDVDERVYWSKFGMLEDAVVLWDSDSANATEVPSSTYTANLVDGTFTFSEEQDGDYYLDGKSYNLHGAIAECLEELAMDVNRAREWQRGGVRYSHYDLMEMAKYHRSLAGARSTMVAKTYRKR
jgi:hypothetical protein